MFTGCPPNRILNRHIRDYKRAVAIMGSILTAQLARIAKRTSPWVFTQADKRGSQFLQFLLSDFQLGLQIDCQDSPLAQVLPSLAPVKLDGSFVTHHLLPPRRRGLHEQWRLSQRLRDNSFLR